MNTARMRFAHVVLFNALMPGAVSFSIFKLQRRYGKFGRGPVWRRMPCGWIGNGFDLLAVNQSVQPWEAVCEAPATMQREPLSDYILNPKDWLFRVAKEIASFAEKT